MIQFLIDILTPVFTGMGVSASDVQLYITNLSGYIYAIVILLVLAAAVMIAAHFWVKKGTRHVVRWGAGLSWVLVVTILANVICFGPLYQNLSVVLNASASISEDSLEESRQVVKEIGEEGIVLLKNEGLLPLSNDTTKLNVFGWSSTNPVFGGTGSGSSDAAKAIGILDSFENAGYEVNQSLVDMYTDYSTTRNTTDIGNGVDYTEWSLPEPTIDYYTDSLMGEAKDYSDVAVITLGRTGGEGQDLPTDMSKVINNTYDIRDEVANGNSAYNFYNAIYVNNGDYDDFEEGESYLELSKTEEAMIDKVCSEFDNVIVVVNANNTMELGWVEQYDSIGAVILAPGTGETGMAALGEIVKGTVNPSGHTVDTFVYDLKDTPTYPNFGNFSYTNVDDLKAAIASADAAYQENIAFLDYAENIYVGYKFYETAAEEGLINYEEKVQYPFGYGLSYTTFSQEISDITDNGDTVSFDVTVTNTGDAAGKDVVEVYFTPPYTNGGIEKASVNLVQYAKTKLLDAGETETINFILNKEDMASYDSSALKTANGGYILEKGDYNISIRSDSHHVLDQASFRVDADIDYSVDGRNSDDNTAVNQFEEYSAGTVDYLSRADHFANYETAISAPREDEYIMDDETLETISAKSVAYYDPTLYDDADAVMPITGADNGLELKDFTGVSYDDESWEKLLDQVTVEEMVNLVNLGGFQTIAVDSIGKKATMDCDGPAGLRNWLAGVSGTAFTTATLLGQTWSTELARRMGEAVGSEYADTDSYGWYGPAMNTHRNSFCGRNFEYYSEDGVLSGYIASEVVNGAAEKGVYAYMKHFALNDQEVNRTSFLLTYSTEQAIREIYLKPFEFCVKNFDSEHESMAMMSSFNFIGDIYCGANPYLLNNVLRGEWGFRGMVLTDWDGSYGYQITDDCVRNGNDIMLGFNTYESNVMSDTDAASCVQALRTATKNIIYTVVNSGAYTADSGNSGLDRMTTMFILIDSAAAIVIFGAMIIVLIRWKRKQKRTVIEVTNQE